MRYYFQPGVYDPEIGEVYWDDAVYTRRRDASRHARNLAQWRGGGQPVYGYWHQARGRDAGPDAVIDVVRIR
jgi:hypothetical protein